MISTPEEKRAYVRTHCEITTDEFYLPEIVMVLDTGGIVGNFCGRGFEGRTEDECIDKAIKYFDKNAASSVDSLVRATLREIGWSSV